MSDHSSTTEIELQDLEQQVVATDSGTDLPSESSSDEEVLQSSSSDEEDSIEEHTTNGHKTTVVKKGVTISFKNLTYSVPLKRSLKERLTFKKAKQRDLIKDITGTLHRGRLIAIMGPSGAGKTTLLNILSDRVRTGKANSSLIGDILINGQKKELLEDRYRENIGYVMQDDVMLSHLTPKEQLYFSSLLRLDRSIPHDDKVGRSTALIKALVLSKCSNTKVGLPGIERGISGGERKRTSIGMELITDPPLLFLDEPTSGLDSTTSLTVIKILKTLTREHGTTVITTIHQPSSEIFHTFDDLFLLSEGNLVYGGPVSQCVDHFNKLGLPCPKFTNPADFVLDVASPTWRDRTAFKKKVRGEEIDPEETQKIKEDEEALDISNKSEYEIDLNNMLEAYKQQEVTKNEKTNDKSSIEKGQTVGNSQKQSKFGSRIKNKLKKNKEKRQFKKNEENEIVFAKKNPPRFYTQFYLLLIRQILQNYREPKEIIQKFVATVLQALVIGLIFLQLDLDQLGVNNRLGAIFLILLNQFFSNGQSSLAGFPLERPLFLREYASKVYHTPTYYFAKSLVDLPDLLIFPIIFGTIVYWMMNLNNEADRFFIWLVFIVLIANLGQAFGFTLSAGLDLQQALPLMPLITIPLALLGGFFLNASNTPNWLIWAQYISPFYWTFQGLVLNEFKGEDISCDASEEISDNSGGMKCPIADYDDVIDKLDFGDAAIWKSIVVLLSIYVFLRLMSLLLLWRTAKKRTANA